MAWERELETAVAAAQEAGALAMEYFAAGVAAETKADASPVTVADRECERLLSARLGSSFPGDGFLGEEGTCRPASTRRRWIVDPIDGTRDFLRGNFLWSNLVALEAGGEVVLGIANFPAQGRRFHAVKDGGAWCVEGRVETAIHCSAITEAGRAVVCMNGLNHALRHSQAGRVLEFLGLFWASRSLGGATDAMLVASGKAEIYLEADLKPWDLGALSVIAKEAGCVFHDYQGRDTIYGGNGAIYAPPMARLVRTFLGLDA